jgi:hypothetical protein
MVKAKTLQVVWHSKEPVYSGGCPSSAWLRPRLLLLHAGVRP